MVDLRDYKGALALLAFDPKESRGRRYPSGQDSSIIPVTNPYLLDITRILCSKAWRRLMDKTQVFASPNDPHVRTRAIHTGEVVATALIIADILGLNRDLCEAIAWGHDLGHTANGHLGEKVVGELLGQCFEHSIFSVVVLQHIERRGNGLNLTWEVLQGISRHSGGRQNDYRDYPMEAEVVRLADKITYTFADLLDLARYGVEKRDLPKLLWKFGNHQRDQLDCCIAALVEESAERKVVSFEHSEVAQNFEELRRWPYEHFYHMFDMSRKEKELKDISDFLGSFYPDCEGPLLLALLTDGEVREILDLLDRHPNYLGIKKADIEHLRLGIEEIVPFVCGRNLSMTDPDLDWGKPTI